MQPLDFVRGLAALLEHLGVPRLVQILDPIFASGQNRALTNEQKQGLRDAVFDLEAAMRTAVAAPQTGPLLSALGLQTILTRDTLTALVTVAHAQGNTAPITGDHRFWHVLYTLKSLQATSGLLSVNLDKSRSAPSSEGDDVLVVSVEDYNGLRVEIVRLGNVLQALADLYAAVGTAQGSSAVVPRITYIESGSPITVAIEGTKDLIEALRGLFRDAWRSIRFYGNDGLERNIESLEAALAMVASLRARAQAGDLGPEVATILERRILKDMGRLLGGGVMLREVDDAIVLDRTRVLLAMRDQKLLAPPRPDPADAADSGTGGPPEA